MYWSGYIERKDVVFCEGNDEHGRCGVYYVGDVCPIHGAKHIRIRTKCRKCKSGTPFDTCPLHGKQAIE